MVTWKVACNGEAALVLLCRPTQYARTRPTDADRVGLSDDKRRSDARRHESGDTHTLAINSVKHEGPLETCTAL